MSLATLLKGVARKGPYAENAPDYIPLQQSEEVGGADGWSVKIFQSSDRGDVTDLTGDSSFERSVCSFAVEDVWSGLAWRLRSKSSGKPNVGFQRRHLRGVNRRFAKWLVGKVSVEVVAAKEAGDQLIGVTQLHWSAGAAKVFQKFNIPYMVFVRDELQFQHVHLYKPSLERAAAVCGAGHGLINQISEVFKFRKGVHIPLPVDYAERFGSKDEIEQNRGEGLAARIDLEVPRIAIVGVTPEKGYGFYQRFLPHMQRAWPEARFDIYGGGGYVEGLSRYGNVTCHGHTPVSDVFSSCDVHLLTVRSTGSWGRVINEAGLFGVPSVSVGIGAQPEAVGDGGIVVSRDGSLDDWVTAIKVTYENREEFGAKAKVHAAVVDHRRSIAMFRSAIRDVLGL
jgi:glycosyltransferase involved in cell wall biosynthesis